MTVTFDAVGPSSAGKTSNSATKPAALSWSHTASGTNRAVLVGVAAGLVVSDAASTMSATYGGVAMTSLGRVHSDNDVFGFVQMFGLVNPPTGASTVVVTAGGTWPTDPNGNLANCMIGGSVSYAGVDQSTPFGTAVTNFSSATSVSASVSSTTGNMVAAAACTGSNVTASGNTSRWLHNLNTHSGAGNAAQSDAAGASSVSMSFTGGDDFWGIVAVDIKAASTPVHHDTTGALGIGLAMTGTVTKSAGTSASLGLGLTASAGDDKTGSATATVPLALTTDAVAAKTGISTGDLAVTVDLSGTAARSVATAGSLALGLAVDGIAAKTGATSAALDLTLTDAATVGKTGAATAELGVTVATSGTDAKTGAAASALALGLDAAGTVTPSVPGETTGALGLALGITGTVVKSASTTASLDLGITTAGGDTKTGNTGGALGVGLDISGSVSTSGDHVAGSLTLTLGMSGRVSKHTSTTGPLNLALATAGEVQRAARVEGMLSLLLALSGQVGTQSGRDLCLEFGQVRDRWRFGEVSSHWALGAIASRWEILAVLCEGNAMSQVINLATGEIEYVKVSVTETGGLDISATPIQLAVGDDTTPGTWSDPDLDEDPTLNRRIVGLLIGQDRKPSDGVHWIWVKVADDPEVIIERRQDFLVQV